MHIDTINDHEAENLCLQIDDASMSYSKAWGRIVQTLFDGRSWHGIANGKVFFTIVGTPCGNLPLSHRDRIEIENRVLAQCPDPDPQVYSCVSYSGNFADPNSGHAAKERTKAVIWYAAPHLNNDTCTEQACLYRHLINHETGHALGLSDPNEIAPGVYDCGTAQDQVSVMHEKSFYGCDMDYIWPTDEGTYGDIPSVESLMPPSGSEFGGIPGRAFI